MQVSGFGLSVLCALGIEGCRPNPGLPAGVPPPPAPFERAPYVQNVDSSSATVLWRSYPDGPEAFEFRTDSGSWSPAPIDTAASGDRRVTLSGVRPAAWLEYRVDEGERTVGPMRIRTAPSAASRRSVHVLAFGDSGFGSPDQVRLAAGMEQESWDLAIHMGDIAYDNGSERDFTERHFRVYRRLLEDTPLFPSPGNHDLRTAGGRPYDEAFAWPAPAPGARFYTFRWGRVRFLALDTSTEFVDGRELRRGRGRQYEWLKQTLQAAAADSTLDWLVVYMHHPLYSHAFGLNGHGADVALRVRLGPLFDRYGVDLVLAGHDHHYERMHAVRAGRAVKDGCGPVYFVTGGGGASRAGRSIRPSPLAARISLAHHYLDLTFTPERIDGKAIGVDGEPFDEFHVLPYPGPDAGAGKCGS